MAERVKVILFNGPFAGAEPELTRTPVRILVGGYMYSLIVDPETGEGLGAYVHVRAQ